MSIRLYVGNLPKELERQELEAIFAEFDGAISTKLITDRKTGKCRGFGFVTVKTDEQADELIEKFNGYMFKDTPLKLEKALPRNKAKGEEEGSGESAASTAPIPAGSNSSPGNNRRKGGSKSPKRSSTHSDPDSVQPDPRWAQELEKLKQLLAAQATNP